MFVIFNDSLSNLVFRKMWITFVAYSARWHGVGFCYIKIGRSDIVALSWGNTIMNL